MTLDKPLEFAEWLPDQPDHANPGATEAKNVIPAENSYRPFPGTNVYSGALTERALDAVGVKDEDGNAFDFAGSATKLWKLNADTTWSDVSKVGNYSTASDGKWSFTKWNQQVIATNFSDNIQEYTLGTSSLFADLAASAPKARYIDVAGEFVVVGNTFDATDGNVPHRVRWCAIGDPTDWTVSASTQADYQDLNAVSGWVQGVVGGEYATIFQEKSISRMTYVGSPNIFQFDEVENGRGCFVAESITNLGHRAFYLAEDGFYMFDRSESISIGSEKVDKTFFNDLHETYKSRIRAAIDPINKLVLWAYPSRSSVGDPDKIIMYNWAIDKWAHAEIDTEIILSSLSLGYTLDGLDSVTTDIDSLAVTLDSRIWSGGNLVLSSFDTDHKLNYFTGDPLSGVVETAERQLFSGNRANVTGIKPIIDGTSTVQVGTRNLHTDSVTWGSAVSPNSVGECNVRSNAEYHRFRLNTSGDFNHAQGIEIVKASRAGRR